MATGWYPALGVVLRARPILREAMTRDQALDSTVRLLSLFLNAASRNQWLGYDDLPTELIEDLLPSDRDLLTRGVPCPTCGAVGTRSCTSVGDQS